MNKTLTVAAISAAFVVGMFASAAPVYAPPGHFAHYGGVHVDAQLSAVEKRLNSVNNFFNAPTECTDPVVVEDTIVIACSEGVITLSQKELSQIDELLLEIQTEIEGVQKTQTDWDLILQRASRTG